MASLCSKTKNTINGNTFYFSKCYNLNCTICHSTIVKLNKMVNSAIQMVILANMALSKFLFFEYVNDIFHVPVKVKNYPG